MYYTVRTPDQIKVDAMGKYGTNNIVGFYEVSKEKKILESAIYSSVRFIHSKPWAEKEPAKDYAYSFAVVGDTQIVTYRDANNGTNDLAKIYDWIVANKDAKNIQYVMGLGDITDKNTQAEWNIALEQMQKLEAAEIPYSLVRGNHELISNGTDLFTQNMGTEAYRNQFITGGFYDEENIDNSWRTFTAGTVDYLIFALDFGSDDDVLAWAGNIIAAHPNHRVIITTHSYLYRDGTTLDANDAASPSTHGGVNDGDQVWEKFISQYENIVLVLSGHDPSDNIVVSRDKGVNGNIVTQILSDHQGVDTSTPTGMVTMLYFKADGSIEVETYSTIQECYYRESNQFIIEESEHRYGEATSCVYNNGYLANA